MKTTVSSKLRTSRYNVGEGAFNSLEGQQQKVATDLPQNRVLYSQVSAIVQKLDKTSVIFFIDSDYLHSVPAAVRGCHTYNVCSTQNQFNHGNEDKWTFMLTCNYERHTEKKSLHKPYNKVKN